MDSLLKLLLSFVGDIFPSLNNEQKKLVLIGVMIFCLILIVGGLILNTKNSYTITSGNNSNIIVGNKNKIKK